jgi:dihydrofolate reductase
MGRVVVTEFLTLDGVIEDPGGGEDFAQGGWAFKYDRGPEGDAFKTEELAAADAQLLGRVTYEGFARAWPTMGEDEFGKKMNSMPKYVVSATLSDDDASWENSTVLRGELAEEVAALKQQIDRDILVAGSGTLARGLGDLGLVDEYRLMVYPLVLGAGKRLFADGSAQQSLRLLEQRAIGADGVIVATYAPADG